MNLYMPVYKQLEDEVASLTNTIFFNDAQQNVYSLSIGNIIVRCAMEIEAISKELYILLGGEEHPIDQQTKEKRNLYFDTDCIRLLIDTWQLDKKIIQITHPSMYFSKEKSTIKPLHKAHKRGNSGSKWKQAYQGIKHNRSQEISRATVENMINALGALYILNLYYVDESFWFGTPIEARREFTIDSKIFTPVVCDTRKVGISLTTNPNAIQSLGNPTLEESIFILKYTDHAYKAMHKTLCELILSAISLSANQISKKTDANQLLSVISAASEKLIRQDALNVKNNMEELKHQEVILNKNSEVYPMLSMEEFLQSH